MKVCVIGGGPAGMMAAISASENGNKVILVEKNEKVGKKLFLTGKGRCNITNSCETEELFQNIPRNSKFLYSSIYSFDNFRTIDFFENNGLKVKEERGKRIFPQSDHSSDVIACLVKKLKNLGVEILLNHEVTRILVENSDDIKKVTGIIIDDKEKVYCDAVIMATGGKSYPTTGSNGKSFELLSDYDIEIKSLAPSLVPLETREDYIPKMQGLSLKNVTLTVFVGNKKKYDGFGEMLFTHFGVSGPLVLSASTYLNVDDYQKGVKALIDLKPALSADELDKRILNDFTENQNKIFENGLNKLLPTKMIPVVIKLSGIDPNKRINLITREERLKLVGILKEFPMSIVGTRGFNEAIITRGGVSVKEINPSTMESKKIKGLYFAGEMIDTDAFTGGFNLQIAWSTGHLAGMLSMD